MPELPEVETTKRGITPHLINQTVTSVVVRNRQLRWPIPTGLNRKLSQQTLNTIERRAKYLLLGFDCGTLILHLGMSGSLRVVDNNITAEKHDHFDLVFDHGKTLRLRDPRRFGAVLWTKDLPSEHKLLSKLGPEPLSDAFDNTTLFNAAKKRKVAIKNFIMDNHVVVGVGNIYASESLFRAGIHPQRAANSISKARLEKLSICIRDVLSEAIKQGGTTLRDFTASDGKPGYFAQKLLVYGRAGEPCVNCQQIIRQKVLGQRASYYCPTCQR